MSCVGVLGAGKLGLPFALSIESKGHEVVVCDWNPSITSYLEDRKVPYYEQGLQPLLDDTCIRNVPMKELVKHSELIFVVVQTPHSPEFDGSTRLLNQRKDFDYTYLVRAIKELKAEISKQEELKRVAVVSTVLPGTMAREVIPLLEGLMAMGKLEFFYNPLFAAMGTVVKDTLDPEFSLVGVVDGCSGEFLRKFYKTIHSSPVKTMSIESAELAKVAYNTFISQKICFANTIMELCHKVEGCDCDDIIDALSVATDRIISPKYLRGGLGDGGGCHPRDNLAMSWLARKEGLSCDIFSQVMANRQAQTDWLAHLIRVEWLQTNLPVVLLGKAYKPECNLVAGSPALLLADILRSWKVPFEHYDPFTDDEKVFFEPAVFFIATRHKCFAHWTYPEGSVVLDPHRYIPDIKGVRIVSIGSAT